METHANNIYTYSRSRLTTFAHTQITGNTRVRLGILCLDLRWPPGPPTLKCLPCHVSNVHSLPKCTSAHPIRHPRPNYLLRTLHSPCASGTRYFTHTPTHNSPTIPQTAERSPECGRLQSTGGHCRRIHQAHVRHSNDGRRPDVGRPRRVPESVSPDAELHAAHGYRYVDKVFVCVSVSTYRATI